MVRRRPGMYIGGTDARALHHLIYEVMDIPLEDAMLGICNCIELSLLPNQTVCIRDNGGSLPVARDDEEGISALELALTDLRYLDRMRHEDYRHAVSGGLHGVGITAVNALSEWMLVQVARDGYLWYQSYQCGTPTVPVTQIRALEPDELNGTVIEFRPDYTILANNEFDFERLERRCKELTYLIPGLTIILRDTRTDPLREAKFNTAEGFRDFVQDLRDQDDSPLHEPIHVRTSLRGKSARQEVVTFDVEFAFQFSNGKRAMELSFTNSVATPDGGTHLRALRNGIVRGINRYLPKHINPFMYDDIASGLIAAISIRHPNPHFESPTRVKLGNIEVIRATSNAVVRAISAFAAEHPDQVQRIIAHCLANRTRRR
jgi:DNA gyrase subunit B